VGVRASRTPVTPTSEKPAPEQTRCHTATARGAQSTDVTEAGLQQAKGVGVAAHPF
jgi:hypothetical protein